MMNQDYECEEKLIGLSDKRKDLFMANNDDYLGKKYVGGYDNDETKSFNKVEPSTTIIPEDSNIKDPEVIDRIVSMNYDNLPGNDKDGDYWVSSYRYQEIYDDYLESEESLAISKRDYARAYEQNRILKTENEKLSNQVSELSNEDRAARSFNDEMAAKLESDSKKLEEEKKRFKPTKIALFVVTALSLVAAITFLALWLSTRTDDASATQRDAAQQEQVRGLRSSLEDERADHQKTKDELGKANAQSDGLTQQLKDKNAEVDKLKRDADSRNKDIERLNNDVNTLKSDNEKLNARTPETVTKTFVQQQEASTQTVTATTTVTQSDNPLPSLLR